MDHNRQGYSLAEVVVVTTLISIISLSIAKFMLTLNKASVNASANYLLRNEAQRLISLISTDIEKVGSGLDSVNNALLFRREDADTLNAARDYKNIFFYRSDEDQNGEISLPDYWVNYKIVNKAIIKETYENVTYKDTDMGAGVENVIEPGEATLVRSEQVNSKDITVDDLSFNFYSTHYNMAIIDTRAASVVRIYVSLSRGAYKYNLSKKIFLYDLINGQES